MVTSPSSHVWHLAPALIAGAILPTMAAAADLPPPPTAIDAAGPLFVELVVNEVASAAIVPITIQGGAILVARSDLIAAGITPASQAATIDVAAEHGMAARYDAPSQRLALTVDPDMLPVHAFDGASRARPKVIADYGAALNYDVYAQHSGGAETLAIFSEQRLFGPLGVLTNSGTWRTGFGGARIATGYVRYDTRFRRIDEDRAVALSAGDVITQSLPWSSAVRLGGVQIARTYRVRPDLVTMPLPAFSGQANLPSAVDLFIDGYRTKSESVQPGRFVLNDLPVVNGSGTATIVTTDALGRQVETSIPFYVASELLRPGLTDFALEGGFIRRGYGNRNFDYGAPAASGMIRRGISDHLTIEGHGEVSPDLALGGVGIVLSPGIWGVVSGSIAASKTDRASGRQLSAGYSYAGRCFTIGFQHIQRSRGYRDLGTFKLTDQTGMKRSDRFLVTAILPANGSLGFAYFDGETRNSPRTRLASLSYNQPLWQGASLLVGGDKEIGRGGFGAQVRLLASFGRNSIGAGASRDRARGMLYQADYGRALPTDGGIGFTASAAYGDSGDAYGQIDALWRTSDVQARLGGSTAAGRASQWAGLSGSLIAMDGAIFTANQVSDAFAVVTTDGVAGVPVEYENQTVGKTDRKGRLFIPVVTSYHPAHYAIDPMALSAEQITPMVETRVALREGSGAVIHMPIRTTRNAIVSLVDDKGAPLAPGGTATRLSDGKTMPVGWDGVVYIQDAQAETLFDVTNANGSHCRARVALPDRANGYETIGPLPCL